MSRMLKKIEEANANNRENRRKIVADFDARMIADIKGISVKASEDDSIVTYRDGRVEKTACHG